MIGTIRKHQTWLWTVIIAATIISFVWWFSPSSRNGPQGQDVSEGNFGSAYGEAITRQEYHDAVQEGRIYYRLNANQWPEASDRDQRLKAFAEQRIVLNRVLDQFHISGTTDSAARFTRQLLGIKPDDVVPADRILETLKRLGQEGGVSIDDIDRFARHQTAQELLVSLVGMNGQLITTNEAAVFYKREHSPVVAEMVSFRASNYFSKTPPAETNVEEFFKLREADYRLPDRIQVRYIAFPVSNYMAQAVKTLGTNISDHVDQAYMQEGPAQFKDEKGNQLSPEAAKAKIKKQMLDYDALLEAGKAATAVMNELSKGHDEKNPFSITNLDTVAKAKGYTVQTSAPFSEKEGTNELPLMPKFLHELFQLRDDDPDDKEHSGIYAPLVRSEDGVYVVGLLKRYPSEVQPFSAVKDKVAEDCRHYEALETAKAAGDRFEKELQSGMSQGKTFDTMCAALFVHPKTLSPFSLASTSIPEIPDKSEFEQVMEVASRLLPGQVSPLVPTTEGGFVLYIKSQLPVDEAALKKDMPVFLARLRQQRQIAAFSTWFGKEFHDHFTPPPGDRSQSGG